jgi:hypothetical protein
VLFELNQLTAHVDEPPLRQRGQHSLRRLACRIQSLRGGDLLRIALQNRMPDDMPSGLKQASKIKTLDKDSFARGIVGNGSQPAYGRRNLRNELSRDWNPAMTLAEVQILRRCGGGCIPGVCGQYDNGVPMADANNIPETMARLFIVREINEYNIRIPANRRSDILIRSDVPQLGEEQ